MFDLTCLLHQCLHPAKPARVCWPNRTINSPSPSSICQHEEEGQQPAHHGPNVLNNSALPVLVFQLDPWFKLSLYVPAG